MKEIADFCESDGSGPLRFQFEAVRGSIEINDSAEKLVIAAMTYALQSVPVALQYLSTESIIYNLEHLQTVIEACQQEIANDQGRAVSWDKTFRLYLAEVRDKFDRTVDTIHEELRRLDVKNKEPEV